MLKADHPFRTEDDLDRASLASRIKDVIANLRPDDQGFTISIEGRWGEGKSWIIGKLKTELIGTAQVVEFNPWVIGNQGALLTEFFACISSNLKSTNVEKLRLAFIKYAQRLAKGLQSSDDEDLSAVGHVIDAAFAEKSKLESLSDLRADLEKKLDEQNNKIVVIIDDIDRLSPREVVEVIRLIKAVGEFPNVVYVIALDPEYVESALRNAGHGLYENYLDKIIQLRVAVPPFRFPQKMSLLQRQFNNFWNSDMMHKSPGGQDACRFRMNQLVQSIAKSIENPRDIVRIWNRFVFVESSCRGEVNPMDLFALQAIYIKAPKLYSEICRSSKQFTNGDTSEINSDLIVQSTQMSNSESLNSKDLVSVRKADLERLLKIDIGTLSTAIYKLTVELFPAYVYRGIHSSSSKQTGYLDNLEVLNVALNTGELTEQWTLEEIDAILSNPHARKTLLEKCDTDEKSINLYAQLHDRASEIDEIANLKDLIGHLSKLKCKVKTFMSRSQLAILIRNWAEVLDSNNRRGISTSQSASQMLEISINVLLNSSDLTDCYELLDLEHNKLRHDNSLFDKLILTKSLNTFASHLIQKLDEGELNHHVESARMFWFIAFALPEKFKLISNTETRFMQWFSIVIDDVVKRYYSGGRTVNYYQINQDQIDALGGNQIVVNHLAAIRKRKNLTQSQFALIKAFENPNLMFDPISGRQISESEL